MKYAVRRYGWVMVTLLLTSCVSIPIPGRGPTAPGGSRQAIGWKTVLEKQEPNVLVATDRMRCEVAEGRFERTDTGDRVFCHWR